MANQKTFSFSIISWIFGTVYSLLLICYFSYLKPVRNLMVLFFLGCMKHADPRSRSLKRRRTPNLHSYSIYSLNSFLYALSAGKGFVWYVVAYYFRSMPTGYIFQIPMVSLNRNWYFFNSKNNLSGSYLSRLLHASATFFRSSL